MPTPGSSRRHVGGDSPHLTAGMHLTPEDGTCLMESVSLAAGLPWSDHPSCTHPLLAHLARLVNDAMSDQGRQALADLVPALTVAAPDDAARTAGASAHLAVVCTDHALGLQPTPLLAHLHRAASAELRRERASASGRPRPRLSAGRRRVFLHGPGARAVEQSVQACLQLPPHERDGALALLLRRGLAVVVDEGYPSSSSRTEGPGPERQTATAATRHATVTSTSTDV